MKRWFVGAVMVVASCSVILGAATTAQAHTDFESSNPSEGSVVAVLPDVVELTFTKVIGLPAAVAVTDPSGGRIETGEVSVIDRSASQQLAMPNPLPGLYVIAYQVTSADGHPINGTVTFTLDAPSGPPPTGSPASAPAVGDASAAASRPVTSNDTLITVADHSASSRPAPTSATTTTTTTTPATTTTTPATTTTITTTTAPVVAVPVALSGTSSGGSGDSNPAVVVLLLVAAASGMALVGLAVRRAVRQIAASTKPSVT